MSRGGFFDFLEWDEGGTPEPDVVGEDVGDLTTGDGNPGEAQAAAREVDNSGESLAEILDMSPAVEALGALATPTEAPRPRKPESSEKGVKEKLTSLKDTTTRILGEGPPKPKKVENTGPQHPKAAFIAKVLKNALGEMPASQRQGPGHYFEEFKDVFGYGDHAAGGHSGDTSDGGDGGGD